MRFDEPWEGNSGYVHFFWDNGIYKMYYIAWNKEKYKGIARKDGVLVSFVSADGIRFCDETVMTDVGAFDTLNIVLWDDTAKRYRGYVRSFHDIPMVGGSDYMDFVKAQKNGSVRVIPGMDTDEVHKEDAGVLNLRKRDIRYGKGYLNPNRLFGDIFGSFWLVVLTLRQQTFVLRTKITQKYRPKRCQAV